MKKPLVFSMLAWVPLLLAAGTPFRPTQHAVARQTYISDGKQRDRAALVSATGDGAIVNRERCSSRIKEGGNYKQGSTFLMGKCENDVKPPRIRGGKNGNPFIAFRTTGNNNASGNDRVELAHGPYLPFNETTYIGFRLRIPKNTATTNEGYYLLQGWQCSPLSPIFGVRVSRGTSHGINFMTRYRNNSAPVIDTMELVPGQWKAVVIAVHPSPKPGKGWMKVWTNGKLTGNYRGQFGDDRAGACHGVAGTPPQHYRVKFGIYKGSEIGKYGVDYDDFRVGRTYNQVTPS